MWPRFGIKIGNSTICLAAVKEDGKQEVIANKHGDRVSQAYLLFNGSEIEIGLTAKQKMTTKSTATVCNNFQLFRDDLDEKAIENALQYIPSRFDVTSYKYELQVQGEDEIKTLSPFDVSVELLKGSFELARQNHSSDDPPLAVLAIPHYYPETCWPKLARAAEEAGFKVVQVIAESTAALLAYNLADNVESTKNVLYMKSGGLLSSFSLFEITDGFFTVPISDGPFYIGGNQFTDALVEFIAQEFYKKYRLDPHESRRSMGKIRSAAENCKHSLTTLTSYQIYVESLMDGVDFNLQMSRARYESLIQPVINEFLAILTRSLDKMGVTIEDIDEIVLAGATMKIPRLQSAIANYFPDATLCNTYPPDEVVVIGCAKQSMYADTEVQELESFMPAHSTNNDIYIWHESNPTQKQLLLKKGTVLPFQVLVDVEESLDVNHIVSSENYVNGTEGIVTMFGIQCGDEETKVQVPDAKAVEGVYRVCAIIEANGTGPLVKLACL